MHGRHIEHHPFNYDWTDRFPSAERIIGGEGWTVFSARAERGFWLIFDDGTVGEFLDPEVDAERLATLVMLERFENEAEWLAAVESLRVHGRPTIRMTKVLD